MDDRRSTPQTRVRIPSRRVGAVPRLHLVARLNQSVAVLPFTLLSAAAGSGKTSLLAEWAAQTSLPTAWLSLDAGDNDPIRFIQHLIAALQSVQPHFCQAFALQLASPQPPSPEQIERILTDELLALPAALCLVLDDYHWIENRALHHLLIAWVEMHDSPVHWLLASREDPPFPLGRWRARHQMAEIRSADLNFSILETQEFLQACMGLSLLPTQAAALTERTEGWVAGLQLAALSLQRTSRPETFLDSFGGSHRHIVDYLVSEVLLHQPPAVQEFLLQTSVLKQLSSELCDAVTQQAGSQAMLEALEQANLFLVPLDDQRAWYRYHALFADLLQTRLRHLHPGLESELHRRAAEWFAHHQSTTEAVQHALAAGDEALAAAFLAPDARAMALRGEIFTLFGWLARIPQPLQFQYPSLALAQAWGWVSTGQLDAAAPLLQELAVHCAGQENQQAEIAALRALIASIRQDAGAAIDFASAALAHLPAHDSALQTVTALSLGNAYLQNGQALRAIQVLQPAVQYGRQTHPVLLLAAQHTLGQSYEMSGQLARAAQQYSEMRALQNDPAVGALALCSLGYLGLGGVLHEQGQWAAAEAELQQGLRLAQQWHSQEILHGCWVSLARLAISQQQWAAAQHLLEELQARLTGSPAGAAGAAVLAAYRAHIQLHTGAREAAAAWADAAGESITGALTPLSEPAALVVAQVRLQQGRWREAQRWLDRLDADCAEHTSTAIEALVLRAALETQQSHPALALQALQRALDLGRPAGYIRPFADHAAALVPLLQRLPPPTLPDDYTARLLSLTQAPAFSRLTERELDVLRRLADGYSNQEIADQLVVALSTVKSHVKSILGKLQVQNRTQAAAYARENGLLN